MCKMFLISASNDTNLSLFGISSAFALPFFPFELFELLESLLLELLSLELLSLELLPLGDFALPAKQSY